MKPISRGLMKKIAFLWGLTLCTLSSGHCCDILEKGLSCIFYYTGIGSIVQKALIPMNATRPNLQTASDEENGQLDLSPNVYPISDQNKRVIVPTADNIHLNAIWTDAQNNYGPTMILCHGSGMVADNMDAEALWFQQKGVNSLAFTIRGYPGSGGSSRSLKVSSALDMDAVFRYLTTKKKIPQDNIAVYGFSLGCAYAAYAARYFNCPVILQNAFTRPGDIIYNLSSYTLMGGILLSGFFVHMPPPLESIPFLLPFYYLFFYPPKMITNAIERSYFDYQQEMPNLESSDLFGNNPVPLNSFNNVENLKHTTRPVMIIYGESDTLMGKQKRATELYEAWYNGQKKNDSDGSLDNDSLDLSDDLVCIYQGGHVCSFVNQRSAKEKVEKFLKKIFPVLKNE